MCFVSCVFCVFLGKLVVDGSSFGCLQLVFWSELTFFGRLRGECFLEQSRPRVVCYWAFVEFGFVS
jgi:hypothetical protein